MLKCSLNEKSFSGQLCFWRHDCPFCFLCHLTIIWTHRLTCLSPDCMRWPSPWCPVKKLAEGSKWHFAHAKKEEKQKCQMRCPDQGHTFVLFVSPADGMFSMEVIQWHAPHCPSSQWEMTSTFLFCLWQWLLKNWNSTCPWNTPLPNCVTATAFLSSSQPPLLRKCFELLLSVLPCLLGLEDWEDCAVTMISNQIGLMFWIVHSFCTPHHWLCTKMKRSRLWMLWTSATTESWQI